MSQEEVKDEKISTKKQKMDYDPTLDFRSSLFDPLKALKTKNIVLPCEDVQPLDNIAAFRKFLPKDDENYVKVKSKPKQDEKKKPNVENKRNKSKWVSPITQMIEKLNHGPTNMLYQCWKEKKRVSVKIRSVNQIHSICEGDIIAFDKHMNLILQNVNETIMSQEDNSIITKKRQIPQLFIKGDNVVIVTRSE